MHSLKLLLAYALAARAIVLTIIGKPLTAAALTAISNQLEFVIRYGLLNTLRAIYRSGKDIDGDYAINLARSAYNPKDKKTSTYSIIEVTNNCPFDCQGCYVPDRRSSYRMSKELLIESIERLSHAAIILIQGGEPLSSKHAPHLIDALLRFPRQLFVIVTNGVYISRYGMKGLEDLPSPIFAISINGTKDMNDTLRFKGSYVAAMKAMDTLRKAGRYYLPVVTLSKPNLLDATSKEFLVSLSRAGAKDVRYLVEESPRLDVRLSKDDLKLAKHRTRLFGHLLFTTFNEYGADNIAVIDPYGRLRDDRTGYEKEIVSLGLY